MHPVRLSERGGHGGREFAQGERDADVTREDEAQAPEDGDGTAVLEA